MKRIVLCFVALIGAIQLNAQDLSKLIPNDAIGVMSINAKSYSSKVDMDKIMELEVFKSKEEMGKEISDIIDQLFEDPKQAGIEMEPKSYMYMQWMDTLFRGAYICSLSDRKKFEQFVDKLPMKGDATVKKAKGYQYILMNGTSIAWNKSVMMLSFVEGENKNLYKGLDYDDENYYDKLEARELAFDKQKEAILIQKQGMISAVKSSIKSNSNFTKFDASNYDVGVWVNMSILGDIIQKEQSDSPILASQAQMWGNMTELWQDTYYHVLLTFDAGEINLVQHSYVNDKMYDMYKDLYNQKVNPKLFNYVNASNMMGFGLITLDIKKTFEAILDVYVPIIDQMPLYGGGKAESVLDLLGIALDEDALATILDGQMLVAVTDYKEVEISYVDYEYDDDYNLQKIEKTRKEEIPLIVAELGIGNQENFKKIINSLKTFQILTEEDGIYSLAIPNPGLDVKLVLTDDIAIITNDPELLAADLSVGLKKKDKLDADLMAEVLQHNQFFYIDIPNVMNTMMKVNKYMSTSEKETVEMVKEKLDNLKLMGIETGDHVFTYRFKASMTDKKTNSAEQLFQMVNEVYLKEKAGSSEQPVEEKE